MKSEDVQVVQLATRDAVPIWFNVRRRIYSLVVSSTPVVETFTDEKVERHAYPDDRDKMIENLMEDAAIHDVGVIYVIDLD